MAGSKKKTIRSIQFDSDKKWGEKNRPNENHFIIFRLLN